MQFLLRGLLAWDLTERESGLGVVYLAFGVGLLACTPLGGVLADRWPKRSLMVFGQASIAVAAGAVGLAVVSGNAEYWMLLCDGPGFLPLTSLGLLSSSSSS